MCYSPKREKYRKSIFSLKILHLKQIITYPRIFYVKLNSYYSTSHVIMYFLTIGYPKAFLLFPITFQCGSPSRHLFRGFIRDGCNVFCAIKSYHLSFFNKMCFCFSMMSIWINDYFNSFRWFNNFQDVELWFNSFNSGSKKYPDEKMKFINKIQLSLYVLK